MINSDNYISIVIPYFKRPEYLHSLIESIRNTANYPYEIVVHDDCGIDLTSWNDRELIAELILNLSFNVGLHKSINRCVSIASSKYILMLNQDMVFTKPILKEMVSVLNKPYVGVLSVYPEAGLSEYFATPEGARFTLPYGVGYGAGVAFRKEFWTEVGGYDENTVTGCSDTPLLYKSWKHGYFRATILDSGLHNRSLEEQQNRDTTIGTTGTDCAYPKIIGIGDLEKHMQERSKWCQQNQDALAPLDASPYNGTYWGEYSKTILPDNKISTMNWENAKKYGQDKWKDAIMSERLYNL